MYTDLIVGLRRFQVNFYAICTVGLLAESEVEVSYATAGEESQLSLDHLPGGGSTILLSPFTELGDNGQFVLKSAMLKR